MAVTVLAQQNFWAAVNSVWRSRWLIILPIRYGFLWSLEPFFFQYSILKLWESKITFSKEFLAVEMFNYFTPWSVCVNLVPIREIKPGCTTVDRKYSRNELQFINDSLTKFIQVWKGCHKGQIIATLSSERLQSHLLQKIYLLSSSVCYLLASFLHVDSSQWCYMINFTPFHRPNTNKTKTNKKRIRMFHLFWLLIKWI